MSEGTVLPPSLLAFLSNIDCRQVTVFCLGWVFITAFNCILTSPFIRTTFQRLLKPKTRTHDVETILEKSSISSDSSLNSDLRHQEGSQGLVFLLSLCFASASVTHFASLCSFPVTAGGACAFVVAWGSLTSEAAHVVGLVIMLLELRRFGLPRWEFFGFLVSLSIGTVFVFVTAAIGSGVLVSVEQLGIMVCYRKRFLPGSLTTSLIYIFLDIYVICRLHSFLAPSFLHGSHRVSAFKDIRMLRVFALLTLELLIVVPSAVPVNILAEFIPFSAGSLIALLVFNIHSQREDSSIVMDSIPATVTSASSTPSIINITAPMRSNRRTSVGVATERTITPPSLPYHPFSSQRLENPRLQEEDWLEFSHTAHSSRSFEARTVRDSFEPQTARSSVYPRTARSSFAPRTARSSRTFDTRSSGSFKSAVVHYARRARHPFGSDVNPFPDLLTFPDYQMPTAGSSLKVIQSAEQSKEDLSIDGNMESKTPPKAFSRPRLMLVTSAGTPRSDTDVQPDSSILPVMTVVKTNERVSSSLASITASHRQSVSQTDAPESAGVKTSKRTTTSTVGTFKSKDDSVQELAMPEPEFFLTPRPRAAAEVRGSMMSAGSNTENSEESHASTQDESYAGTVTLSRTTTFGGNADVQSRQYRARGYANPIQSRWSSPKKKASPDEVAAGVPPEEAK